MRIETLKMSKIRRFKVVQHPSIRRRTKTVTLKDSA